MTTYPQKTSYIPNHCPECDIELFQQKHIHIELDHCSNCQGIFVGLGKERHLIGEFGCQDIWIESKLCKNHGPTEKKSPVENIFLEQLEISHNNESVDILYCPESAGMWTSIKGLKTLQSIMYKATQGREDYELVGKKEMGSIRYGFQLLTGMPIEVWHPKRHFPWLTTLIIFLCATIYPIELLGMLANIPFTETFLLSEKTIGNWQIWGLITYIFLHGGLWHLFGNMYFLWILGDNVEDKIGTVKFGLCFLLCGIAGGLLQLLIEPANVVGASGAIAGIMAMYLVYFPWVKFRLILFFFPLYIPNTWFFLVWIAQNLLGMYESEGSGVAFACHIGGFLCGFVLAKMLPIRNLEDYLGSSKS